MGKAIDVTCGEDECVWCVGCVCGVEVCVVW